MKQKALIVGGGIGGMTTAIALRQIGWEVEVFERASVLGEVGAGISLWPNATRLLRRLGVLDAIVEAGSPIQRVHIRTPQGRLLSEVTAAAAFEEPSLCIHRAALHQALTHAVPADAIRLGHPVEQIVHADQEVAVYASGQRYTGDLLIGSDGIHSRVRQHLLGDGDPVYRGYAVWRGIAPLSPAKATAHTGTESWGRGQRFGIFPVSDTHTYWYATANEHEPTTSDAPEASKTKLLHLFGDWHTPIPDLLAATPETAILKHPTLDRPPNRLWCARRMALLGDAAHAMTPNLGQGACQAIEDATMLAYALQQHGNVDSALQAYNVARFKRTRPIVQQSLWMGAMGQWEQPLATALRDFLLWATPSSLSNLTQKTLFRFDVAS